MAYMHVENVALHRKPLTRRRVRPGSEYRRKGHG